MQGEVKYTGDNPEVLMANLLGLLYIAGIFFLLLTIYCVHVQFRRQKYRQIADALGAEYQSQGPFKSGKITGASNQRKYTIENPDGARGAGMWTVIEMQCENKGIPLWIRGGFFKSFPNWEYAVQVDEKYRSAVEGLFHEFALLNCSFLKKGILRIEQNTISFTIGGILRNLEVMRQILSVLAIVADRIESGPIGDGSESQQKNLTPATISVTLHRHATPSDL
jgi:hypothetical protein